MSSRYRKLALGGLLVALAMAGGVAAWLVASGGGGGPGAQPAVGAQGGRWSIEDARNFTKFPLYWLGESYKGLPLRDIVRSEWYPPQGPVPFSATPPPEFDPAWGASPSDSVVFAYWDEDPCAKLRSATPPPSGEILEGSCGSPPVSVVVSRGCLHPLWALREPISSGQLTLATARGAQVMVLGPNQVTAWTGSVAVDVFVSEPDVAGVGSALEAFQALMSVDPKGPQAGDPLPPPERSLVEGPDVVPAVHGDPGFPIRTPVPGRETVDTSMVAQGMGCEDVRARATWLGN